MKGMRGCCSRRPGDHRLCVQGCQCVRSCGFIEKAYENAVAHEMRKSGLGVVQQRGIVVFYDDVIVGEYTADLIVEDQVIVERKGVPVRSDVHLAQCRNHLRATGKPQAAPPWAG